MITIGVTSFNRGKYLRVLLDSLYQEYLTASQHKKHQVIVVDNCSTERRVYEVLSEQDRKCPTGRWLDENIWRSRTDQPNWTNDEYIAKNIIIKKAKHPIILFLQDDLQFIGPPGSIEKYAQALIESPFKCLTANGVRRSTISSKHTLGHSRFNGVKLWRYNDDHYHTMGFFKKSVFEEIGEYPTNWPLTQEYWGRSEDWYDRSVRQRWPNTVISATSQVPLFLPVWNDPRGGYAFLRNGKRYGHYLKPVDECGLYYSPMSEDDWVLHDMKKTPCSFADVAKPLGWCLPKDVNEDPRKYPQSKVIIEGPISEIDT